MPKRKITQPKEPFLEPIVRNSTQLGASLLRFRKWVSLTQKEVGERSGIKQSIVSQVESGIPGTRLGTLFKLLAALDLELVVRSRKKTLSESEN
jgi:HTH-type transcriptional regulator/antitoxin HipB